MKTSTLTTLSVTGLFTAAAAWALHQQVEYVLSSLMCGESTFGFWIVTAAAVLLLLIALVLALGARRATTGQDDVTRPRRFLASLGLLAVGLFFFAIFLQASALFFLPSCT